MIEFKPEIKDNIVVYRSYENGDQTGRVTLTLDTATHCTLRLIEASDPETAEGLIRSALTAAANRNSFACVYMSADFTDIAKNLGFTELNGSLYGEIPFLLSGCCGCNCNQMS
ncbi:MAG: hypothetical protein IJ261_02435 [Clostridia bacterium]|nr:hypothetical protein [Clostridia bacterium]